MKKVTLLLLLSLSSGELFSQLDVRIWLKALTGTSSTTNGAAVNAWVNQAGSNNPTFTGTATYNSTSTYAAATYFNYNPSLTFGGTAYMTFPDAVVSGLSPANIFYVLQLVETTAMTGPPAAPNQWRELHNFASATNYYFGMPYNAGSGSVYGDDFGTFALRYNHTNANINAMWNVNYPFMYNTANEGASFSWSGRIYCNSTQVSSSVETAGPGYSGGAGNPVMIFNGFNTGFTPRPLLTTCSEILMVGGNLTANERSNINSYLALKHGITLVAQPKNYTATDNAATKWTGGNQLTIWNSATNTAYNNNIIGIGRNDIAALHQKQSKSVNYANSGNLLSISTAALSGTNGSQATGIANDNSYFMVGDNLASTGSGNASTWDPQVPVGIYAKIHREWLARATNFTQNVTIGFDRTMILNNMPITTAAQLANLRLLVDDDGNFSNATVEAIPATFNATYPNVIEFVGVANLGTGSRLYFTLATVSGATPLPVELKSFNADCDDDEVLVSWVTAAEHQSDHFTLSGSSDGLSFEKIAVLPAAGNAVTESYYEYSFRNSKYAYLRLTQTDQNGATEEYLPITVSNDCLPAYEFTLYPNPSHAGEELHLEYNVNRSETVRALVYNTLGQLCSEQEIALQKGGGFIVLDKSKLTEGIYTLVLQSEISEIAPQRFILY